VPNPLVIQKPELPASINPQGASVFDAPGQGILRKMVSWLGLDDPQQVMGVGAAMDVGPMGGGLIDAVAQRFPRFAAAIKAYHGSPHDFEAFDTSKIGTGEGAQAYGHGLYFAENPQVAEEYKKAFTGSARDAAPVRYQNIEYPSGTSMHRDLADMKAMGKDAWMAEAQKAVDFNKTYAPDQAALWQSRIKTMQSVDPSLIQVNTPKMYEVGINAHPDQFLDWDKPLSQQHPDVQAALQQANAVPESYSRSVTETQAQLKDIQSAIDLYRPRLDLPGARGEMAAKEIRKLEVELSYVKDAAAKRDAQLTGANLYQSLAHDIQGSTMGGGQSHMPIVDAKAEAARRFREVGIPGIKYLDQGSRAAGEGSRNFVVFDAKTVDILKKYGLLPPAVGATIAAQQSQQGEQ
jgi:hypothetical protein